MEDALETRILWGVEVYKEDKLTVGLALLCTGVVPPMYTPRN